MHDCMKGTTVARDDAAGQAMLRDLEFIFSSPISTTALLFPWVQHVLPSVTGYTRFRECFDKMRRYFGEQIEEHRRQLQEDNPRDFMDVFLIGTSMLCSTIQLFTSFQQIKTTTMPGMGLKSVCFSKYVFYPKRRRTGPSSTRCS